MVNCSFYEKEKISTVLIDETLAGISEGLKPIIDDLDVDSLSEAQKDNLLEKLGALEKKALEIKGR
ncbi:MAG: hypothetical protein ACI9LN_000552 [Saprospiraceae bacterium]|jgi:hypothetical protein